MVKYLPDAGTTPMSSTTLRTGDPSAAGNAAAAARLESPRASAPAALSVLAKLPSLRQLPFFAGVPEELLLPLATRCRWQTCAQGEVVVDSGDASSEVFFVAEGAVRVVVRTALGYEAILNDLGAGSFFGELAAIDGVARSANVTALQRTRLCAVPGAAFMEIVLSLARRRAAADAHARRARAGQGRAPARIHGAARPAKADGRVAPPVARPRRRRARAEPAAAAACARRAHRHAP